MLRVVLQSAETDLMFVARSYLDASVSPACSARYMCAFLFTGLMTQQANVDNSVHLALAGSQLESMPDPVKNFWEAPSTPYQWKHSHVSLCWA